MVIREMSILCVYIYKYIYIYVYIYILYIYINCSYVWGHGKKMKNMWRFIAPFPLNKRCGPTRPTGQSTGPPIGCD